MQKTTILIAEDHNIIRETWSYILNDHPGLSVVAEVGTAEEAIELVQQLNPNVVLMDINLPGIDGFEATKQILEFAPATKVVGVSMHTQLSYARQMIHLGAMGYVTKSSSGEELIQAILDVMNGNKHLCNEIREINARLPIDIPGFD
jgi:two-component system invasion response regulator UvrY